MTPEQRARLNGVKLRALVHDAWGDADADAVPFGGGAALRTATTAWLLVVEATTARDPLDMAEVGEQNAPRGWLGGAALWASRARIVDYHVLLDHVSGDSARRAALLRARPKLWRVSGRAVEAVHAIEYVGPPSPPIDELAFAGVIEAAGADAVVEHGVLIAEVLGLEVGRVVGNAELGPTLAVGVGRHDRLANDMLGGQIDSGAALAGAVAAVLAYRCPGAPMHPANRLAPERWLRAVVCANPSLVGAATLEPCAGTEAPRLKRSTPAVATGVDLDGRPLVVGCTVGIDLDSPVFAADARAAFADPASRLVLCTPEGDDVAALRAIASLVINPAEVVVVSRDWRDLPTPRLLPKA